MKDEDQLTESEGGDDSNAVSPRPPVPPSPRPQSVASPVPPSPRPQSVASPALLVILAEGFLSRLSFGIISFALPLFAYRKLGLSLTATGVLFSLNLAAEQLFKPLMGWVADRFGLKRSFSTAIAIRSLVALLLCFAGSAWQIYAIRLLHGFSEAMRDPSVSALIAENADKRLMASSFAWYNTAKQSAGALGKALGGLLLGWMADDYSRVFAVAFFLSFFPLFVVGRYLKEPARPPADAASGPGIAPDKVIPESENRSDILPLAVLGFLIACTAQMINNLFPVLAIEHANLSAAQAGSIYLVSVVVVIIAGPLFGWVSDHLSEKLVLTVRGLANTFSSLVFYFSPNFAGLAAGSVADAAGKAAFRPAWGALMARVSSYDRSRRARMMSYLSLGEGLGETIGPILGGFLWNTWGIGVMLATRIGLAIVGELYAIKVARAEKS